MLGMNITVLIDNKLKNGEKRPLKSEWGLSILIEFEKKLYLLDSGQSKRFSKNADILGMDLSKVENGILSHAHYDHSNGLKTFFKKNQNALFYLRKGTAENTYHKHKFFYEYIGIHKGWLKKYASRFSYADGDFCVAPNVYLIPHKTAELGEKGRAAHLSIKLNGKFMSDNFYHEQSLVFKTEKGLVIFNSCSHGGADNIIQEIESTFPNEKIYAILGGFHLFCLPDSEIFSFAERLKTLAVQKIVTGHCTGDHAYDILHQVLGEKVSQMYTGMQMEI